MAALRLTLAIAAGLLHGSGWLFPGMWYTVWPAQAALILLGVLCTPKSAFLHGFVTGAIGIGCSFYWGMAALNTTIDASPLLAAAIFSALVAWDAVGFGVLALVASLASRRGVRAMWLVPVAWAALEFWYPRIFPWMLGYSQLEVPPILQIAELFGSTAIGFVMTAALTIPAVLVMAYLQTNNDSQRRMALRFSTAAVGLLVATLIYGGVRQWQWAEWTASQPKLRVALLQVDTGQVGSGDKLRERSLAIQNDVDLICWPESSIGTYCEELEHFRDEQQTLLQSRAPRESLQPNKDFSRHLLAGGMLYREGTAEEGPYAMAALLVNPSCDIIGRYRKRTLLPFGEYVPGQSYYPEIRSWATLTDLIEAGTDPSPVVTEKGERLGVLICYEDVFSRNARHTVAHGAEVLFSLVKDSAFSNPLTLIQHHRLSVMRSVENRRYFARCSSTGVTCIVAPTGQIVSQLPLQTDGTLVGDIVLVRTRSVYNLIGDVFPWGCTLVMVGWLVSSRMRRRSTPTAAPQIR